MHNGPEGFRCSPLHGRSGGSWMLVLAAVSVGVFSAEPAGAYTSESPEVKQLVAAGLKALEAPVDTTTDQYAARLGGKCVVGLAFVKANRPEHPRVAEAVAACRAAMTGAEKVDVYSNGLAIVFLCELNPKVYRKEIDWYLNLLQDRQKPHGGWGYDGNSPEGSILDTGDTSQTQYAALGYWSAYRNGLRIDSKSLEGMADWLVRTQDPTGCWGYQGTLSPTSQRVGQSNMNCSMLAAGLSSTLICVDLINATMPVASLEDDFALTPAELIGELPEAVRLAPAEGEKDRPAPVRLQTGKVTATQLFEAIDLARKWMDQNYVVDIGRYTYYYLYATERYQSFYELISGISEEEPKWYNDGFEFLSRSQRPQGGWSAGCGPSVDTAFAVLFLLRSTQKSIQASLGEGTLVGGRGLPANVARAKLRGNQIVVEQVHTKVEEMLAMIDDAEEGRLDELARDPTSLVVDHVDEKSGRRLQQLVRGGEPEVRLLAVRALGRSGNLDYVPTLIYALTDPEPSVVLEARDGLRFLSRRFEGFGPPDNFTEEQRYEAVDAWKHWYRTLRPGALPE